MFCPFCGGANPDDVAACAHCGQPVRPGAQPAPAPPAAPGVPGLAEPPTFQAPPPVPGRPMAGQDPAGPYTCLVCGYILGAMDSVCTRCKTPRGMQVNPDSPIPGAYTQTGVWRDVNTSGQKGDVPAEISSGWNWGAFGLHWIWGLNHKTYITLLIFLQLLGGIFIGLPLAVWFGIKGNTWAWQNRRFESIAHFRQVQRIWMYWAIPLVVILYVYQAVGLVMLVSTVMAAASGAR